MTLENITDEAVIIEAQRTGDIKKAMEFLYDKYFRVGCSTAYGVVRNYETAREIGQDCMMNIYNNLNKFDTSKKFYPWFITIVKNKSVDYFRDSKRNNNLLSLEDVGELDELSYNPNYDQELINSKNVKRIFQAIKELHGEYPIIFDLLADGKKQTEIAEILGIENNILRGRIYLGRQKLKEKLKNKLCINQKPLKGANICLKYE